MATPSLAAEAADVRFFLVRALDAMADGVQRLDDERVNGRPSPAGANSVYAIVTHCLGVLDYWCGHVLAGRQVERDRRAEFTASGTVEQLLGRLARARDQLDRDLAALTWGEPVREQPAREYDWGAVELTQRTVLLHLLEELATHRGHLELTVDLVLGGGHG